MADIGCHPRSGRPRLRPASRWRCLFAVLALVSGLLLASGCEPPADRGSATGNANATDNENEPSGHQMVLRISTGNWAPYFSRDLPHGGTCVRVIREAFRLEGYDVEFTFLPWTRAYEQARPGSGEFDGTGAWGLSAKRVAEFVASDSIFDMEWVFFHRRDFEFDWQTLADLKGLTIGGTHEYTYGDRFYAAEEAGTLTVEWVPSDELNYRKLMASRIDIFPQDRRVGRYDLRQLFGEERATEVTSHPRPLGVVGNHLLMPRGAPHSEERIAAFNRGLAVLRGDGRLERWLAEGVD